MVTTPASHNTPGHQRGCWNQHILKIYKGKNFKTHTRTHTQTIPAPGGQLRSPEGAMIGSLFVLLGAGREARPCRLCQVGRPLVKSRQVPLPRGTRGWEAAFVGNRRWVWPLAHLLPAVRSRANHRTPPTPLYSKGNRHDDHTSW